MMEELLDILRELHPEIDFEKETRLIDAAILDSFDLITLLSELADTFDVVVPAKEIVPENFNSAEALWELIKRLESGE